MRRHGQRLGTVKWKMALASTATAVTRAVGALAGGLLFPLDDAPLLAAPALH
jgi:hypothetical protein